MNSNSDRDVARAGAMLPALRTLLEAYGLSLRVAGEDEPIPGSYWGDDEAGLIGATVWIRGQTPVHSVLHEACHFVCMSDERRRTLHTDAGGDDLEECAVCYLSVLLSDRLPEPGRSRMFDDMDRWGYSFRLGSAEQWFTRDADDARAWLIERGLIDVNDRPVHALLSGARA